MRTCTPHYRLHGAFNQNSSQNYIFICSLTLYLTGVCMKVVQVAFGFNFLVLFVSMDFIQSYITQFVSMGDFFSFLSDC